MNGGGGIVLKCGTADFSRFLYDFDRGRILIAGNDFETDELVRKVVCFEQFFQHHSCIFLDGPVVDIHERYLEIFLLTALEIAFDDAFEFSFFIVAAAGQKQTERAGGKNKCQQCVFFHDFLHVAVSFPGGPRRGR